MVASRTGGPTLAALFPPTVVTVTFTVPAGAVSGPVTVTTPGGTSTTRASRNRFA